MNIFWILSLVLLASCGGSDQSASSKQEVVQANHVPQYLYKIVSPEQWRESQLQRCVVNSPIDTDFIHLATDTQVSHVVKKFWSDKSYLILKLNTKKLHGRLVYETNPGGSCKYYHLYEGTIPLHAVVSVSSS